MFDANERGVAVMDEDRFWSRVRIGDDCWEWQGAISGGFGYGSFNLGGRGMGAHRASWILAKGPIPDGLFVCHRCDNPRCVRPGHLFLGTHQDNVDDMRAKGRHRGGGPNFRCPADKRPRGEHHGMAKLTAQQVREIRARLAAGERKRDIASAFGVSKAAIKDIASGRKWAVVE